jgi:dolichol-phosphate mannosyltransferase
MLAHQYFGEDDSDCSGGYRCYRAAKLRQVRLERIGSRGYSFQQEILYRCRRPGCRIG